MSESFPSGSALEVPPGPRPLAEGRRLAIILQAALDDARVILTLATDFGTLLAHSGDAIPGVVLFRGEVTRRPEGQAELLLANLDQFDADLTEGAIVVIGDHRIRARSLPIDRGG